MLSLRAWMVVSVSLFLLVATGRGASGHWLKYQSKHTTIFSRASDRATRNWAGEFEQVYAMLAGLFPEVGSGQPPLTVLLFDDREEYERYRPMQKGRAVEVAGYFSRLGDRGYVVLNLDASRGEARRVVYHEAVHWFFSASPRLRPAWLEEGLAEYFSTARIKSQSVVYGEAVPPHVSWFEYRAAEAVPVMLAMSRDDPHFHEPYRAAMFYATSWLFVHRAISATDKGDLAPINRYLGLREEEIPHEEAFKQAFGCDYAGMNQRLAAYVRAGKFRSFEVKFARHESDYSVVAVEPSRDEINLELGSVLALASRPEQAKALLGDLEARRPDDFRIHEALGMMAVQAGEREAARKYFQRAVALGSRNPYCYLGPVIAELDYRSTLGGRLGALGSGVARAVADDLRQAIRMEPNHEEYYYWLAQALLTVEQLTDVDTQTIEEGLQRFPKNIELHMAKALYLQRRGESEKALEEFDLIATTPRWVQADLRYAARQYAHILRVNTASERYRRAVEAEDFPVALQALDERMALTPGGGELQRLRAHRLELEDQRDLLAVRKLREAGQLSSARPLLEHLVRDSTNEVVRRRATNVLRELDEAAASQSK